MWDLSSLTRDRTHTPCIGRRSLNHWTTREVPGERVLIKCVSGVRNLPIGPGVQVTLKRKTKQQQTVFLGISNALRRRYIVTAVPSRDICSLTRQAILQEIHPMT